jgi:hypothetical protein
MDKDKDVSLGWLAAPYISILQRMNLKPSCTATDDLRAFNLDSIDRRQVWVVVEQNPTISLNKEFHWLGLVTVVKKKNFGSLTLPLTSGLDWFNSKTHHSKKIASCGVADSW